MKQNTTKKPHGNTNLTKIYQIIIKETGEVVGKYRLRMTARNELSKLKKIYPYKLEVQEI